MVNNVSTRGGLHNIVMEDEIWLGIPNYPNYEVSSLGRIRSIDMYANTWFGKRRINGRVLIPYKHESGYLSVCLGSKNNKMIHVIVAIVFWGHDEKSGFIVDHKNNIKDDNRSVNIQVTTHRVNNTKDKKNEHTGCSFDKKTKKYRAYIWFVNRRICLGYFNSIELAHQEYKKAVSLIESGVDLNTIYKPKLNGGCWILPNGKWRVKYRCKHIGVYNTQEEAQNKITELRCQETQN